MDNDRPRKSVRWPEDKSSQESRPPVEEGGAEDYFNYSGGSGNRPATPRAGPSAVSSNPIAAEAEESSEEEPGVRDSDIADSGEVLGLPQGDDGDEEFNYNYRPIDRISHKRRSYFRLGNENDDSTIHEEDEGFSSSDGDGDNDEERNLRAATRANTWFNRRTSSDEVPRVHITPPPPAAGSSSSRHHSYDPYAMPVHPMGSVLDFSGAVVGGGLAPGAVSRTDEGADNDPHDLEYRQRRDALLSKLHARSQPSTPLPPPSESNLHPPQEGDIPLMELDRRGRQQTSMPSKRISLQPPPMPKAGQSHDKEADAPHTGDDHHHHREISTSTAGSVSTTSTEKPEALHEKEKDKESGHKRRESNESHRSHTSQNSQNSRENVPRFRLHETPEEEEERKRHEERVREEAEELARKLVKAHLGRARSGKDAGYVDNPQLVADHDIDDAMRTDPDRPGEVLEPSVDSQEDSHEHEKDGGKGENRGRFIRFLLGKSRKGDEHDHDDGSSSGDGNSMEKQHSRDDSHGDDGDSTKHHDESEERDEEHPGGDDYIPPPQKVKEGVLGSLLRLYAGNDSDDTSIKTGRSDWTDSTAASPVPSRDVTPLGTPSETPVDTPRTSRSGSPSGQGSMDIPPAAPTLRPTHSSAASLSSLLPPGTARPSPAYQYHNVAPMGVAPHDAAGMAAATSAASSLNASKEKNKHFLRRPQFSRAASSEDVLGRENRQRPKWYQQHRNMGSTTSLGKFAAASLASVAVPHLHGHSHEGTPEPAAGGGGGGGGPPPPPPSDTATPYAYGDKKDKKDQRRLQKRLEKQKQLEAKRRKKERLAEQMRITVHIADVLQRQRFILRLGRALMLFGAPSHRLEEYLKMTARVLEIDCQLLYMPGCMLVSFGDAATHTSETKLIRVTQGLNLTKLHATHLIYKEVVHDIMDLEEASAHIDNLLRTKNIYPWWLVVIFYGLAGACLCMFSFGGRWPDFAMTFLLAAGVGFLQNYVQPRSDLYSNIFEVSSSIFVSFVGRALGSISYSDKSRGFNGHVFCFAAMVEGSLALILPGYIILCGALELQSRNLVAGAVRMFYATIYSLFLSFGITLGSLIFGWCAPHTASRDVNCPGIGDKWKILFVPLSTMFMAMVNQASYRQLPVMVFVGSAGYTVLYFVQNHLAGSSPFTSAMGAFTMGILGNLYSRIGHGLAFAAMLPGVFVIVPSGVAAQGSLVAGVEVANAIVNETSRKSSVSVNSETQAVSQLGNTMTQVAVGITVGLFAATLVVYPLGLGKKRSGLFTF